MCGTDAVFVINGIILGLGITDGSLHLSYGSCIRVSFAIFQISDFIAADIHIAAADSSNVGAQFNLGSCSGSGAGRLVADGRDARQIFCQLNGEAAGRGDIAIFIRGICCSYYANVATSQLAAIRNTACDAESIIGCIGVEFRFYCGIFCVSSKFQTIIKVSDVVRTRFSIIG